MLRDGSTPHSSSAATRSAPLVRVGGVPDPAGDRAHVGRAGRRPSPRPRRPRDQRAIAPDSIAFLQLTSGSTGVPRAVCIPHRAAVHNPIASAEALGRPHGAPAWEWEEGHVLWLPLHHDMGLVGGILYSLLNGLDLHLASPRAFLARPRVWLELLERGRPLGVAGAQLRLSALRRSHRAGRAARGSTSPACAPLSSAPRWCGRRPRPRSRERSRRRDSTRARCDPATGWPRRRSRSPSTARARACAPRRCPTTVAARASWGRWCRSACRCPTPRCA